MRTIYAHVIPSSETEHSEKSMPSPQRKATNLSLDTDLLAEAKKLNINLSRAAEAGLCMAVMEAKAKLWKSKNAAALESSNKYVERFGLPLDTHRPF